MRVEFGISLLLLVKIDRLGIFNKEGSCGIYVTDVVLSIMGYDHLCNIGRDSGLLNMIITSIRIYQVIEEALHQFTISDFIRGSYNKLGLFLIIKV